MFYLFPFLCLVGVLVLSGVGVASPFIYSFWLSCFTSIMVFFFLFEAAFTSGVFLYLIEESLSAFILWGWLMGGGFPLFLFLFVKGALAPLHKWFVEVLGSSSTGVLVWGLSFHKLPFIFLLGSLVSFWSSSFLFLSFLVGVFLLFKLGETRALLILSSSNTLILVLLFLFVELGSAIIFFFCYVGVFWSSWVWGSQSVDSVFVLLGMSGQPPFYFFQLKWSVLGSLFETSEILLLFLAILSGVASFVYIRLVMLLEFWNLCWSSFSFLMFWLGVSLFLPTW